MIKDEDKDENLKEVNNIVIFVIYILTRDIDNVGRNNEIWYEVHDFVIENNGDLHQDYVILPKVNQIEPQDYDDLDLVYGMIEMDIYTLLKED